MLVGLFAILALVSIVTTKLIVPLAQYIKVSEVVRKYSLKMEKDGYLSPVNISNMNADLISKGFSLPDISVDPSTSMSKVNYNDDVTICLNYTYKYKDISMDGIIPTVTDTSYVIKVSQFTIFKGE